MYEILLHLNPEQNENLNISLVLLKQTTNPINFLPYLKIVDVDYRDLNIPKSNTLSYVCGYLYNKFQINYFSYVILKHIKTKI